MHQVFLTDNLFDSLLSLPKNERDKALKTIQQIKKDPSNPGLKLHRIIESPDDHFWTARISQDARIVLYKKDDFLLICHADKHDEAYAWAKRRRVSEDAKNHSAKIVSIDDYAFQKRKKAPFLSQNNNVIFDDQSKNEVTEEPELLFKDHKDEDLTNIGFDVQELSLIRSISSEEDLYSLEASFSAVKFDKLLSLYLNIEQQEEDFESFQDEEITQTELIEFTDSEDVRSALSQPWEQWLIFLSYAQRKLVRANFKGSSKVFGSAGTGKTVVALHRAKYLIEKQNVDKVGLFTFSRVLTQDLKIKADLLLGQETSSRQKLFINSLEHEAGLIFNQHYGKSFKLTGQYTTHNTLKSIYQNLGLENDFTIEFVISEYENIIGPWNLYKFEDYKNFPRKGRGTPLTANQRKKLSECYTKLKEQLSEEGKISIYDLYHMAADILSKTKERYKSIIIDEAQDLGPHMLRFVRALTNKKDNDIMLCGDVGQSLYYRNHSWLEHGIDIRGKSSNLYINYRTSKQIKDYAEVLNQDILELEDKQVENRKSISTFNGPKPEIRPFQNQKDEINNLVKWIKEKIKQGIDLHEIVVLSREVSDLKPFSRALKENNISCWELDASSNFLYNEVGLATVARVKGLEYRCVAIVNCNEDQFPSEKELEKIGDISDEDSFLIKEINLLYVAMTRARDNLYISYTGSSSMYLDNIEDYSKNDI